MKMFLCLIFLLPFISATAQNSLNETLKQQMLKDWERAKAYTHEYLEVMPADKYGFRPVDSVRTFADQMLHFALSNAAFAFIGTGTRHETLQVFMNPDFGKSPASQTKDSVMFYVNTSYDIAIAAIKNINPDRFGEVVTWTLPGGRRTSTRLGWLLKAFEHQTHHRGQCTVYLRSVSIRPPAEKLWD